MATKGPRPSTLGTGPVRRVLGSLSRHRVLVGLLVADIATKVAAFRLLPHGEPVELISPISLYLAVNDWGVMGGVHGIGAVTANPAYTMLLAFGLFVFAYAIVRLGRSSLAFGWRLLAGAAVFVGVAIGAHALSLPLRGVDVPADVLVPFIRFAALTVSVALYVASTACIPRAAFTLFAAGALSNAASYAYPPYEVVDFLMVPAQPFLAAFGAEAVQTSTVGVVNLADLYLFAVPLVLLLWPLAALSALLRGGAFARARRLA